MTNETHDNELMPDDTVAWVNARFDYLEREWNSLDCDMRDAVLDSIGEVIDDYDSVSDAILDRFKVFEARCQECSALS
jgi:hypothetical protein